MIEQIINNFKNFIERKGWTHKNAAEAVGCCRPHMSRILNGERTPSVKLLMKMEEVMKIYGN